MYLRSLLIMLALSAAACGRPEFGATSEGGEVIDTDVDRAGAESENNSSPTSQANAAAGPPQNVEDPLAPSDQSTQVSPDFAFTVYRDLAARGRNVALAPHGLARSLVISYASAGPGEAAAVAEVLQPYLGGDIYSGFNADDLGLESRQGDGGFQMLGGVWLQDDVAVESEFVDVLARYLGIQARLVDFASSPEDARSLINNWHSDQTSGRISEVLGPRTIDSDTRFLITDATWFSAGWGFAGFDPDRTTYETFAGTESNVQLPMMATDDVVLHVGAPDFDAVVLPFDNGFSLFAVLPDDLDSFEASLEPDFLDRLVGEASPAAVSLRFPRIEVSGRISLSAVADAAGVSNLFAPSASYEGFADDTRLDDAHQRTRIAFDESGVMVGSAGNDGDEPVSSPPVESLSLRFDRPFFFAIRDTQTGKFVMLGRFAQP